MREPLSKKTKKNHKIIILVIVFLSIGLALIIIAQLLSHNSKSVAPSTKKLNKETSQEKMEDIIKSTTAPEQKNGEEKKDLTKILKTLDAPKNNQPQKQTETLPEEVLNSLSAPKK